MIFKNPFFKDTIWYLWWLNSSLAIPLEQRAASDGADTHRQCKRTWLTICFLNINQVFTFSIKIYQIKQIA